MSHEYVSNRPVCHLFFVVCHLFFVTRFSPVFRLSVLRFSRGQFASLSKIPVPSDHKSPRCRYKTITVPDRLSTKLSRNWGKLPGRATSRVRGKLLLDPACQKPRVIRLDGCLDLDGIWFGVVGCSGDAKTQNTRVAANRM
jgi:hypothetical protein